MHACCSTAKSLQGDAAEGPDQQEPPGSLQQANKQDEIEQGGDHDSQEAGDEDEEGRDEVETIIYEDQGEEEKDGHGIQEVRCGGIHQLVWQSAARCCMYVPLLLHT